MNEKEFAWKWYKRGLNQEKKDDLSNEAHFIVRWKMDQKEDRETSISRREEDERICKYCDNYISQIMVNEECCKVRGCSKFKEKQEKGDKKNDKSI